MSETNAVRQALFVLQQRRREVEAEKQQLDQAISALEGLSGGSTPSSPSLRPMPGPSVRTLAIALMDEEDRDWSTSEILTEYERRGAPVHGKDPNNALRAALADAKKKRLIVSTGPGRYKSARWAHIADIQRQGRPGLDGMFSSRFEKEGTGA